MPQLTWKKAPLPASLRLVYSELFPEVPFLSCKLAVEAVHIWNREIPTTQARNPKFSLCIMKHLRSLPRVRHHTQQAPLPMVQLFPLPTQFSLHCDISRVPPALKTWSQHLQEELEQCRTETAHDMLAKQMTGQGTHQIFCPLLFLTLYKAEKRLWPHRHLGRQSHNHQERGFSPSTQKSSTARCRTEPHSSPMSSVCPWTPLGKSWPRKAI